MPHDPNAKAFQILGIHHLGLAAQDPEKACAFLKDILHLDFLGDELVSEQKTHTFFFATRDQMKRAQTPNSSQAQDTALEVLKATSHDSPISKFLEKKGSGIHHLALRVDDIEKALVFLKSKAIPLIDESPRIGAHHSKVVFIHPRACGGILIELVQEA